MLVMTSIFYLEANMALTAAYWRLSMTFIDRANKPAVRRYRLVATDDAGDATDVLSQAATVIANFQAVSDCIVKEYQVEKLFLDDSVTIPSTATALSTVVAQVTGKIRTQPNESGVFDWPGPKDAIFISSSGPDADKVNMAFSTVDAVADMFDLGGSNLLLISDGEQLNRATMQGVRATKKRTRRGSG